MLITSDKRDSIQIIGIQCTHYSQFDCSSPCYCSMDMKVFLLFSLFAVANGAALNDQISSLLECIKSKMSEGVFGSPPLDPFVLEHQELNLNIPDLLNILLNLNHVSVVGLSSIKFNDVKFTIAPMSLKYDFDIERITVQGYYDVDGTIKEFIPVYGKGSFNIVINNLHVNGKMNLKLKGGQIELLDTGLNFDIGSLTTDIEGLLGGGDLSDLMNRVISDIVPEFITKYKQVVNGFINDKVKDLLIPILSKVKLSDLIEVITGDLCSSAEK